MLSARTRTALLIVLALGAIGVSKPFTGWRTEHYPSGQILSESHYAWGRLDGESRDYSVDHRLQARWNYRCGVKHGTQLAWFLDGARRFEQHFKNGLLDGEQTEWHENGQVFRRTLYRDGVEIERKVLFEGGEVFSNYVKRDDRKFGLDGGSVCMERKREGER